MWNLMEQLQNANVQLKKQSTKTYHINIDIFPVYGHTYRIKGAGESH